MTMYNLITTNVRATRGVIFWNDEIHVSLPSTKLIFISIPLEIAVKRNIKLKIVEEQIPRV